MLHLSMTEWLFMIPFALAVLFMLWVFWRFSLELSHKREPRDEDRKASVRILCETPVPRRVYRPESVPLNPGALVRLEYRRFL